MNFSKHLQIVLAEMCRRVGVDFKDVDFTADNWFQQYKWTEEEQEEFGKWFVDYLYENTEARKEITTVGTKNKRRLRTAVSYFIFDFGWSLKTLNDWKNIKEWYPYEGWEMDDPVIIDQIKKLTKELAEKTMVSICCEAGFKVAGRGMTHWHVCEGCGEPCDIKNAQRLDKGRVK